MDAGAHLWFVLAATTTLLIAAPDTQPKALPAPAPWALGALPLPRSWGASGSLHCHHEGCRAGHKALAPHSSLPILCYLLRLPLNIIPTTAFPGGGGRLRAPPPHEVCLFSGSATAASVKMSLTAELSSQRFPSFSPLLNPSRGCHSGEADNLSRYPDIFLSPA